MKILAILLLAAAIFGAAGFATYKLYIHPQQAIEAEKLLPPAPPPPDPALPEFEKCVAIRRSGKLLEAREALYAFVEHNPESSKIDAARNMLGDINTDLFLSTRPAPEKETYIVQRGDVINRVAGKLKSTPELLMRANNLEGTMLRIGQKLTISPADFSLVISRKYDKVFLLNKGRFFKQYAIRAWPPAHEKKLPPGQKAPPMAKVPGKVTDKIAWLNGTRVIYTEKGYANAIHWIQLSIPHCTLYTQIPGPATPTSHPAGGGIAISPEGPPELAAMLRKGTPVTLE